MRLSHVVIITKTRKNRIGTVHPSIPERGIIRSVNPSRGVCL